MEHRELLLRTPLYFAASMGFKEAIIYFMQRGCDVNVASNLGRTALLKACWNGEPEVAQILLSDPRINVDYLDSNNRLDLFPQPI